MKYANASKFSMAASTYQIKKWIFSGYFLEVSTDTRTTTSYFLARANVKQFIKHANIQQFFCYVRFCNLKI
ncbi:unnamed protein product [Brugia timori]|uniref:Uncharacterized protein n=1 Tax=Brugia timori TaxID=42155 RepID=A0A3P7T9Z9_9BILA|nr:unnamed protein product [Brugia timori]